MDLIFLFAAANASRKLRASIGGILTTSALVTLAGQGAAQDSDLAKQLSNPIANLTSVPLQYNFDSGYLDGDGEQHLLNLQPVIPISISPGWNLISRTIIPMIERSGVVPGAGSQSGIGGIIQSLFFSPKAPTANGLIWGAGPVVAFPTIEDGLGSEDWGLGLTAVALKTNGPWTMGILGNHVWSVTDNDDMEDYSNTFLQPFLTYTTAASTTFALNLESTYDWKNEQWSIPVNANVSQLIRLAGHPVSIGAGVRYWAEAPENGPENWGARLTVTYLFPK